VSDLAAVAADAAGCRGDLRRADDDDIRQLMLINNNVADFMTA